MRTAFTGNADFSCMAASTAGEPLHVSEAYHETFLALDEHGTEAAAIL